ncbi:N-6 DNA methylase [Patescibacteria group bacterium]|nr:N-6 DNA methylase [Patescibacteria group bacterium]
MHSYIFILGSNPTLSLAEIRAKFSDPPISILSENACLIKLKRKIPNAQILLNTMGGTIKIAQEISTSNDTDTYRTINHLLQNNYQAYRDIGFSFFGLTKKNSSLLKTKQNLKKQGFPKRFIFDRHNNTINAATIKKNKLLSKGIELIIVKSGHDFTFGQTLAHQDVDLYTQRDYGKPKPDADSGMLPPKLAQIMINLATLEPHSTIYDPFCGSGTIPQEAILQHHHIFGSDISDKAVHQTKENLKWLIKNFQIDFPNYKKNIEKNIFKADATNYTLPKPVDAIITEPYLGPAHRQNPTIEKAQQIINHLAPTYYKFLNNTHHNLKSSARLVMIIPIILTANNQTTTITEQALLDQNTLRYYNQIRFEQNLVYQQPNQKIHRSILVLEKK